MKTFKLMILFVLLMWGLTGCNKKIRSTDKAEVKKTTTIDFKDKTQTITTKTADSLVKLPGSSLIKSFTPRPYDPAIEADSLDSMETENAELKIKTITNKKTGKITTQGTAKPRDVHFNVNEKIVENRDVSLDLKAKSDSSSKKTEKTITPPPGVGRLGKLFEMICVISLVVAGTYLGLRFMIKRSQV